MEKALQTYLEYVDQTEYKTHDEGAMISGFGELLMNLQQQIRSLSHEIFHEGPFVPLEASNMRAEVLLVEQTVAVANFAPKILPPRLVYLMFVACKHN